MKAVIVGPDRGLEAALRAEGVQTARVTGVPGGRALREAGVDDADLFVLTDVEEATTIAVAKDLNPGVRAVVYSPDTVPEFVKAQLDVALSPAVMGAEPLAEELAAG